MQISPTRTQFLTNSIASLSLLRWSPESTLIGNNLPMLPGLRGPRRWCCGLNRSPCLTFPLSLTRSLCFWPLSCGFRASRRRPATRRRGGAPSPPLSLVWFRGLGSENPPCRAPFCWKRKGASPLFVFIFACIFFVVWLITQSTKIASPVSYLLF